MGYYRRRTGHCGFFWFLVCIAIAFVGYEVDQHAVVAGSIVGGVFILYVTIVALMRRAGRS